MVGSDYSRDSRVNSQSAYKVLYRFFDKIFPKNTFSTQIKYMHYAELCISKRSVFKRSRYRNHTALEYFLMIWKHRTTVKNCELNNRRDWENIGTVTISNAIKMCCSRRGCILAENLMTFSQKYDSSQIDAAIPYSPNDLSSFLQMYFTTLGVISLQHETT